MPTADVNGITIHYEVHGRGRPLLVILGLGSDVSENTALIDELAAQCQVVAFDNRGAGRSGKPDAPYSIEMMAEDALGIMDAVQLPRAAVLGISLGGRIAMELALRHPERVERLLLVSTSARITPNWRRRHLWPILAGLPLFRSRYPQPRFAFVHQLPRVGRLQRCSAAAPAPDANAHPSRTERPVGATSPRRAAAPRHSRVDHDGLSRRTSFLPHPRETALCRGRRSVRLLASRPSRRPAVRIRWEVVMDGKDLRPLPVA